MRRRWLLLAMWGLIAVLIVIFVVLAGPGLLVRYNVARLTPAGTPEADSAFNRLDRMGKCTIPPLLDAIEERDAAIADIRRGKRPQFQEVYDNSIVTFHKLREASPVECRADLCTALLVKHWNRGLLSETEQRRLLHQLQWGGVHAVRSTGEFSINDPSILLYVHFRSSLGCGTEGLWVQRRVALLVRSGDVERLIAGAGLFGSGNSFSLVGSVPGTLPEGPTTTYLTSRGESVAWFLLPRDLGVGKHSVFLRVSYGPTTKSTLNQPEESPWYEEFTFGPADVTIVDEPEN